MKLGTLINVKANYNALLDARLLEMVCFFQDNMWDGYSDENDPKFINKDDFDAVEALSDKISHMIYNIGCPVSVEPMIQSIITRKVKHWQGSDSVETDDRKYHVSVVGADGITTTKSLITKGHKKGKQLKSRDEKRIVWNSAGYYGDKGIILSGHFRWNNRGYILSRRATDLLESFYLNNFDE